MENKIRENELLYISKEFWERKIEGQFEKIQLPERISDNTNESLEENLILEKELSEKINKMTRSNDLMVYVLLTTVVGITIDKLYKQNKFLLGTAQYVKYSNENNHNSFLIIETNVDMEKSYKEMLVEMQKSILGVYKYQMYRLKELYMANDIFNKVNMYCCMKNIHDESQIENILNLENNEMTIIIERKKDAYELIFKATNKELANEITIFKRVFENILSEVLSKPEVKLKDINIISELEKKKILIDFNNTKKHYFNKNTLIGLFEKQVLKSPNRTAVVFEGKSLTYNEIHEKVTSLAGKLIENGVGKSSIVAIMTERSIEMIVGILAILKSGAAYLPISPEYPDDRKNYLLEDSGTEIVLTQNKFIKNINEKYRVLDLENEENYETKIDKFDEMGGELAYIIYTSGTTGRPKGVKVNNKAVINTLLDLQNSYPLKARDAYLLKTNYCFDVSVTELFGWFIGSGRIVILKQGDEKEPNKIITEVIKNKVTHINFTSSMFNIFLEAVETIGVDKVKCLKYILTAGEELRIQRKDIADKFLKFAAIENLYGPTEASIYATKYSIKDFRKAINIGKPLQNTQVYILNELMEVVPIGSAGELYLAGKGLAEGYLNNEKLTKEKFIENPFKVGMRMYKTGDLARWSENGEIEYIGRKDNQVKIRGYRLELGEIENALSDVAGIKFNIVLDKTKNDGKFLVAYYISDIKYSMMELKEELKEKLPDYMIPLYLIEIKEIPLTNNGKLNIKELPEPIEDMLLECFYEEPKSENEKKLAKIWREILGLNKIGLNNNFFEIGGHSLNATMLVSKIQKELHIKLSIRDIFEMSTIKEISEYIDNKEKDNFIRIEKCEEKEFYDVSSAQKRMYLAQELSTEKTVNNMPYSIELGINVELTKLEKIFTELLDRHESLRTGFEIKNGVIVQKIYPIEDLNFKIQVISLEDNNDNIRELIKPFNLEKPPLIRVSIIKKKNLGKNILFIDMHHIISDGTSIQLLIEEFNQLYLGKKLEDLRLQYKDYAQWQKNKGANSKLKCEEEYWLNEFSDDTPILNLPSDYLRKGLKDNKGKSITFEINKDLTSGLKRIVKETESTMYMILLAQINILLSKYSGQDDIVVGSPISGRNHIDLEKIVGMFVNTLAIRTKIEGQKSFVEYLKIVRNKTLNAYENQDYQFDEIVEKLNINRDLSRNPLFDVMFVLQNNIIDDNIESLGTDEFKIGNGIEKFDLTFSAIESKNSIKVTLSYATMLYKEKTIRKMIKHFINIIETIVESKDILIKDISLINREEEINILESFNNIKKKYSTKKTVNQLFEEQVKRTPHNIAVKFEEESITYDELNNRAIEVAKAIRKRGVQTGDIVSLMLDKSIDMIVGIIGILKSGAAYLPIDINLPVSRIEYMLENSGAVLLISNKQFLGKIETKIEMLEINKDKSDTKGFQLDNYIDEKNLAYTIYTSGTTGNPKGVCVEHRSIINTILWRKDYYKFGSNDIILQLSSPSFDCAVAEILVTLISGAKLFLVSDQTKLDLNRLAEEIEKNKVTSFALTPTFYNSILQKLNNFSKLRTVIVGGEKISKDLVGKHFKKFEKVKLFNEYGPTEGSVSATVHEILGNEKKYIIGKPISNTKIYIVDNYNKLCPPGILGELCVSGVGLARGYLNNPILTKEKFVDNPFEMGEKMYKTGDVARWLENGEIEYIGRVDHQVKIRGYRIELGEIENCLSKIQGIKENIVLVKEKERNKYLVAYYVAKEEIGPRKLRELLKESLPDYMIPLYFIRLDLMPMTSNGKVDTKILIEKYKERKINNKYEPPRDRIEKILIAELQKILKVKKIGINDNFFELGADSIKLMNLLVKLKERQINLTIEDLFRNSTVKGIREIIESKSILGTELIIPLSEEGKKNIFGFPPIGAFGTMYIELSKVLDDVSFYGCNFQCEENLIENYANQIIKLSKGKEIILLGYSLGASLAFEVGKVIEQKGVNVSNFISIDGGILKHEGDSKENINKALKQLECHIRSHLGKDFKDGNETLVNKLMENSEGYIKITSEFETSGKINADIHVITSNGGKSVEPQLWGEHTRNRMEIYQGSGLHLEMLSREFLVKNGKIIRSIVK